MKYKNIFWLYIFRPYDGKWSKSMVGYGAEDNHFVVELTYNYGVGTYKLGNDFRVSTELLCITELIYRCNYEYVD